MSEPSALDRQWVQKLSHRAVTTKTPAKTTEARSVIHCESFAYHNCVFIMQPQQQSGSSGLTLVLAILFWGWFFASLILH